MPRRRSDSSISSSYSKERKRRKRRSKNHKYSKKRKERKRRSRSRSRDRSRRRVLFWLKFKKREKDEEETIFPFERSKDLIEGINKIDQQSETEKSGNDNQSISINQGESEKEETESMPALPRTKTTKKLNIQISAQKKNKIMSEKNDSKLQSEDAGSKNDSKNTNGETIAEKDQIKNTIEEEKKEPEFDLIEDEDEAEMQAMFGFSSFTTTKGKDHSQTSVSGVFKNKKVARKYRQYMNRPGGFNKKLDKI